ncbi:putative Ig domain-containing protein [Wielerella bovis]|nr:putative Ig domain-containing protein [Wielerella bovis]
MEGIAIKYALSGNLFTDEDIETLTYEVTLADGSALPSWLRYDEKSKTIIGIPQKDNVGQLALKVTAKDAEGLTTSINWNIVVEEKPNRAPIATVSNFISPIFKENEAITYTLPETLFIDDDVDPLTYHVQSANGEALPEWLNFDSKTRTLSGMPDFESAGFYPLRIIATDSKGLSSSMTWQLEVSDTNRAPTVENSIPTQNITAKEDWQYHLAVNNYFQDLDTDDELSYTVTLSDGTALPSWLHYDADTQTLSGNAPQKGQYHLAVTATDKAGETATQTLIVNVALPIVNNGGENTIIAGSANEILEGSLGSDTYIFGKQFGQDTVINFNPNQQDNDILRFTHTKLSDMTIQRNESDLVLTQKDGQRVIVQNFFDKDGKGDYSIQSIEFADGKTLDTEQLRQWVTSPTTGNDKLYAYAEGGKIYGGNGDDVFIGNTGIDYFVGGAGNDILQGGKNDDRLEGGIGNDTYLFNLGDGNDRIYDSFGSDILKLGQDITKQDLWFSRTGRDLTIQILGQQDSVTIEGWYNVIPRRIETIQMADGAYLDVKSVQQMVQAMASFAPQQGIGLSEVEQMQAYAQQMISVSGIWK